MKKLITLIWAASLFIAAAPGALFAADGSGASETPPSNVIITVVLPESPDAPLPESPDAPLPESPDATAPESGPDPAPLPAPVSLYPLSVTEESMEGGVRQIVKTYELSADEDPADIPRADFERLGYKYTLTDILRKETAHAETRAHSETVTLHTDTKEIERILAQLAPTLEYKGEDGFAGVLTLQVESIKVETAGTKTTSYTAKITREYPRLSASDPALIPKQVEDKGKTYTLTGVEWQAGNYVTIDYEQTPEYYTAVATYAATAYSTQATGYVTTAVYSGPLSRLARGGTYYTACFLGEEIRTTLEFTGDISMTETASDRAEAPEKTAVEAPDIRYLLIGMPLFGAAAGALYYFIRKKFRKEPQKPCANS
jgi:hypothetical protein